MLDHVIYPNDFPAGPSKTNLPSSGLLLPDASKGAIPKYALHGFISIFEILNEI